MTFVDFVTPIPADWLNNVNTFVNTPTQSTGIFNVKLYGATGNGTTDDTAAIKSAITAAVTAGEGTVYFPPGTYIISSSLVISNANIGFRGDNATTAVIKSVANASGFVGYNPNAMIILNGNGSSIKDLTIDGNINSNVSGSFGGISNTVAINGLVIQNTIVQNCIYNGIQINPLTGSTTNFTIKNNTVQNVGWGAISAYCSQKGIIDQNTIISCGADGIRTDYNSNTGNMNLPSQIRITNNFVTKATPPSHIVSSATETGFMIVNGAGDSYMIVDSNVLYDNRNANQDGLGLGQDGVHVNEGLIWTNNTIIYAGLYGLDMSSNHIAANNYIRYSAQQGIKFGTDAGGNLVNSTCVNNIIDSCNLAGSGTQDGIWVAATLTASIPTALYENIKISGNRVVDFNPTPHTIFGLNITFQNNVTFQNNEFNDNDWTQLAGNTQGNAFHTTGPGANFQGWTWKGNKHPVLMPNITGTTPNIMALDSCFITQTSATNVTNFLGGYNGKEVVVQHQDGNSTYVTPIFNKTAGGNTTAASASIYKFFQYGGAWLYQQFY